MVMGSMAQAANSLVEDGKSFNADLISRYDQNWATLEGDLPKTLKVLEPEHFLFYRAIAQSFGTLHHSENTRTDLVLACIDVLAQSTNSDVDVAHELKQLSSPPRRLSGIVAGLQAWRKVELPEIGQGPGLDLEAVQRRAIQAGGIRWTSLIPQKFYWLLRPEIAVPRSTLPPLGAAVLRGIEKMLGIRLGNSGKDQELARQLHLQLADLAGANIYDVNTGIFLLGDGR